MTLIATNLTKRFTMSPLWMILASELNRAHSLVF